MGTMLTFHMGQSEKIPSKRKVCEKTSYVDTKGGVLWQRRVNTKTLRQESAHCL